MSAARAPITTAGPDVDPDGAAAAASRWPARVALAGSALLTAVGLWSLVGPDAHDPLVAQGQPGSIALLAALGPAVPGVVVTLLGVAGLVLGIAVRVRAGAAAGGSGVTWGAAVIGVPLVLLPDMQLMAVLGYVVALTVPAAVLVAGWACVRRGPVTAVAAVAVVGAAVVAATTTGTLDAGVLASLGGTLVDGFARVGPRPLVLALAAATGVAWLLVAHRSVDLAGRHRVRVLRAGRVSTLVAAGCLLPYVLVRATWLSPWPTMRIGVPMDLSAEIRLWGLALGAADVVGIVLTLGLVRPWGERFPRWTGPLAGRPVPVALAVVPGAVVAYAATAASPALLAQAVGEAYAGNPEALWLPLVLPFWLWGPALGVAVGAYALRRAADRPHARMTA